MILSPQLYCAEQGVHHLVIIDEIDEAETQGLLREFLVGTAVYDTGDTSHRLPVAVSHI